MYYMYMQVKIKTVKKLRHACTDPSPKSMVWVHAPVWESVRTWTQNPVLTWKDEWSNRPYKIANRSGNLWKIKFDCKTVRCINLGFILPQMNGSKTSGCKIFACHDMDDFSINKSQYNVGFIVKLLVKSIQWYYKLH